MNWLEIASKMVEQNNDGVKFAPLSNIAGVDIKFDKGYGTIKVYVKKGLSLNYHIKDIPNPEEVYNLIMENIKTNSNEQEK